jgi:hypothetical protein
MNVNSVFGTLGGVLAEVLILWRKLLLYTNATSHQLIEGGVVGCIAGMLLADKVPVNWGTIIITSLIAVGSMGTFDWIVYGEKMFPGLLPVLLLLSFFISASLSVLGTMVMERVRSNKPNPANEQAGS